MNTSLILKRFLASKRAGKTSHCRTSVQMPPTVIIHFDIPRLSRNFHLKTVRAFKKICISILRLGLGSGGGGCFQQSFQVLACRFKFRWRIGWRSGRIWLYLPKFFTPTLENHQEGDGVFSEFWGCTELGLPGTGLACEACVSLASGSTENLYYLLL